ncbi:probable serine/threonine-protein kinase At1g01540 isoform X1 [Vigna radiata var. radiata]|uniref:non-specific serine/threonine protein kinase n=1 Tax=Vigna radiata var. radiata TaxID=3916 RepID=A0A1S3TWU2_VIGRR|nr:probable serine/threonine-protein kinase At1g01540 isoform X1 [Vigna radiata var. radiata]
MSIFDGAFMNTQLSKHTSIFGLRLWVVIGILIGVFIVFTLFLLSLCLVSRRNRRRSVAGYKVAGSAQAAKEIHTIVHLPGSHMPRPPAKAPEIQVEMGKAEHRVVVHCDRVSSEESKGTMGSGCETTSSFGSGSVGGLGLGPEVSHLGWGRWYTLRELEDATGGLCPENVVGEGGYGIVYHGVLNDGTKIAVKNLLNNKGQAEKEFKVEVEAIGRVRHKNLVRLLGYCVEGAYRMLVYEYVDNGNLEQWLHGDVGPVSPLTWNIRMNIILGTARGLAYLHEGLEPKVVHRDVKSSNILIDRQWNSKVSDFGLAKLLCSENSYVTTRVMGTFGYVAPEYACTGMLTEKSDIYSFGILIMEIITGRSPVDYARPQGEVNLIEWLKTMVGNRKSEEVVDPKLPEMPSSKALKRALLIALRCVDPDATKRPKMGHVIHMLEADDMLFHNEQKTDGDSSRSYQNEHKDSNLDKRTDGVTDQSEDASSSRNNHQATTWR